jgi:putative oxidoreductase
LQEDFLLQRLYSTFPDGRPGAGLLFLRLAGGGFLIAERVANLIRMPPSPLWELHVALICVGACLCLGLWTPIAGGVEAAAEVAMTLSNPLQSHSHILLAVLALSLMMLGPGAWSIDALIFGRKRITVYGNSGSQD